MAITFQKEWFLTLMPELPTLFLEHYEEIALDKEHMVLNPGWKQYVNLETAGVLHILTARDEGKLIGYHFNLCYPHLHYSDVLCSFSDMFFMLPLYRKGYTGVNMFIANEKMLKELGVKKMFVMTKVHKDMRPVMKRLKYKFIERIFSKWIGD